MSKGRVVLTADATLDAGEFTHTFYPAPARTGYPVIFLHGAGLNDMIVANAGWPAGALLGRALRRAGIATAQILAGGTSMANDTAMSRITTARATLATRTGCSSAKAHLVGISMGAAVALRYAALNPTKVASINALVPATNLLNLQQRNPGSTLNAAGFAGLVATAWGLGARYITDGSIVSGTNVLTSATGFTTADNGRLVITNTAAATAGGYSAPKVPYGTTLSGIAGTPTTAAMSNNATATASGLAVALSDPLPTTTPNADLLALAPAIAAASIPVRFFYSTVDAFIDPADVEAMRAAVGGTKVAIDSTYGHANGSLAQWAAYNSGAAFSDLIDYLKAQGA